MRAQVKALLADNPGDGYFTTGKNKGAQILREAMHALHRGEAIDDVSGEALDGELVKAARRLELEFFERMGVYTRVPRSTALAPQSSRQVYRRCGASKALLVWGLLLLVWGLLLLPSRRRWGVAVG